MDLNLEPANPAVEIASLIERGEFDHAKSVKELIDAVPTARNIIVAAAFRALGARKWFFERGKAEKQWEPDYKTQLEAVKWLAGYSDGLPVQTTLAVNVGDQVGGQMTASLEDAVERSPALREKLAKLASGKPHLQRVTERRALPAVSDPGAVSSK